MSIHRLAAIVLVPLLVSPPGLSVASAAAQTPAGGTLQVNVDPSRACVIAGEHPQFQGSIVPMSGVRRARLFFRSAFSAELSYVEAVLEGGRYVARLPCAQPETGLITFYLDASGDGGQGRSADGNAIVVRRIEECPGDRRAAPISPGGPVSVFGVAGNPASPPGFECVTRAAAAGAGGADAGAAAGSEGSFFGTKAGAFTLAALGLGIGTVIFITQQDDEPTPGPTSPSR